MKKIRQHLMLLTAAVLLIGTSVAAEAGNRVKVVAKVKTPYVTVRIGNTTSSPYRSHRHGYEPRVACRYYKVTKQDRRIARRLSRYTGVPASAMLRFKQRGYTWREIGRFYDLPRPVVRAAMDGKRWHRFLEREHCVAGGDHRRHRHGHGQVVHLDD